MPMRHRGQNRERAVWVPALVQRNMQQRYMELQEIELSKEEDGNEGEIVRTRKPLDDSWASIGRDMVEVLRRLPGDVHGLLTDTRHPVWRLGCKHPNEACIVIVLALVALVWLYNNLHILYYLDLRYLRQEIYGISRHPDKRHEAVHHQDPGPYASLEQWPRYIDENSPEKCSFRKRTEMRRKFNHLTVRFGLDLPDHKRKADLHNRLGTSMMVKDDVQSKFDYLTRASTYVRGIPVSTQAHLDEYILLRRLLTSCKVVFGDLYAVGGDGEQIISSKSQWSEVFDRIHQEETGEKKQTHTYGKHFMETTSDYQGDFWGF